MNLEREIENIKRRLDAIEAVLPRSHESYGAKTDEPESRCEIVSLEVKKSQSMIGPEYAYKLTLRNTGSVTARGTGWIIFLDSSHFEVRREPTAAFTIAAGASLTVTGKITITDPNHVPRIDHVTAEVHFH